MADNHNRRATAKGILKRLSGKVIEANIIKAIDKVTIIDGGNGNGGVGNVGGYVPAVLAQTIETVKEVTGLDIVDIMKANTYDAKVTRNINVTGLSEEQASAAVAAEATKE